MRYLFHVQETNWGNVVPALKADPRKTLRVLVVDDNLDQVHTMAYLLKDMGHQVDYAINGTVGLDLARRVRPHVILLDVRLPDLSGMTVARELRRIDELKLAFIIGITAHEIDEREAKLAGFDYVLRKPVELKKLENVLQLL